MKCFEINLMLFDSVAKTNKNIRQYFQQDKGACQAILDTIAWINLEMKGKWKKACPHVVIDSLVIWSWNIGTPQPDGSIKTMRSSDKVLNWSFEKGLVSIQNGLKEKHKKRFVGGLKHLNRYRIAQAEVQIEEIGGKLEDNANCFHLSALHSNSVEIIL